VERERRVEPFTVAIPQASLEDLRLRLERTRWPDGGAGAWQDGTDLAYLEDVVAYWRDVYDWRRAEARLNAIPAVRVRCGELRIHALHVRGTGPNPLPLVLTHGWPGSIVEMLAIIPLLTDPGAHGGDPADAFHVVVPSLPGYGFSDRPTSGGIELRAIARMWLELMSALGYERFGAQGGDWGAGVSTQLALTAPERIAGVHLNFLMRAFLPGPETPDLSEEELAFYRSLKHFAATEGAYAALHGTKPQSVAYGLNDSPAGLAAWILEKFRTWSDCGGDVECVFSRDDLLTNISIYWHTQTIGSSIRLYRERALAPPEPPPARPNVPFGFAAFPKELWRVPRSLIERSFRLDRYSMMPRGGHFAAMEQPELLADEIRAFFRPHR
jgi:pimeloyl-ACP methyl ester carboxylesterase